MQADRSMKAFVINLDRSEDRLSHMQSEFGRIGATFTRFPAVDGARFSEAELADFARARKGISPGRWLAGEVGIFLSHFGVWQKIAAGGERAAAVFEDDVHLAHDLRVLLSTDAWIPADADVVRLETNRKMLLRHGRRIAIAPRRRIYRAASGTWGAAGYVLTRHAAAKLLQSAPSLHCPVDIFLFKPGRSPVAASLRCYQVVPAICIQSQLAAQRGPVFESLVGTEGRAPRASRRGWSSTIRLLPWKKYLVPFRP
jgi:glycosyl transferase family 25